LQKREGASIRFFPNGVQKPNVPPIILKEGGKKKKEKIQGGRKKKKSLIWIEKGRTGPSSRGKGDNERRGESVPNSGTRSKREKKRGDQRRKGEAELNGKRKRQNRGEEKRGGKSKKGGRYRFFATTT